jgi:hypothetical protein
MPFNFDKSSSNLEEMREKKKRKERRKRSLKHRHHTSTQWEELSTLFPTPLQKLVFSRRDTPYVSPSSIHWLSRNGILSSTLHYFTLVYPHMLFFILFPRICFSLNFGPLTLICSKIAKSCFIS